jgi:predicted thioredoxin/glutaredoxin
MKQLLPLVLIPFVMAGCATTGTDGKIDAAQTVENALPYITPAVTLTCTVVLDQALSPTDRVDKAKMINHVAAIVEGLTAGTTPTPEQLQKALTDYLPVEKMHWVNYVTSIKDLYAAQFSKINGNTKLTIDVLNAIAKGCKNATANYVE